MLLVATELERPGVPLAVRLGCQFWPVLLRTTALRNSSDDPNPSAWAYHSQPREETTQGRRTAQSPWSENSTKSTRWPEASSSSISSPPLLRRPTQLPTTLVRPGYLAWRVVTLAATTRYAPALRV